MTPHEQTLAEQAIEREIVSEVLTWHQLALAGNPLEASARATVMAACERLADFVNGGGSELPAAAPDPRQARIAELEAQVIALQARGDSHLAAWSIARGLAPAPAIDEVLGRTEAERNVIEAAIGWASEHNSGSVCAKVHAGEDLLEAVNRLEGRDELALARVSDSAAPRDEQSSRGE